MLESIHQSTLNMALRCGEQIRRRHFENDIIPPSIPAARGTGVHAANEVNLKAKVITHEDMLLSDLQDAARDGYLRAFERAGGQVYLPKEDLAEKKKLLGQGLDETVKCTQVYHQYAAPDIQPVKIEEPFLIDVGLDLPLAGTMDYQEKPRLGDLKTSSKKWPEGREKSEIQAIFYSFVHERETGIRPDFIYHVLIAHKEISDKSYQHLLVQATEAHYKALFAKLETFIRMLKAGVFPPANPTSWWCSPKWCGYYETCKYVV